MQLKDVIDLPCGLRHSIDRLEIQSGFARRWMLGTVMLTDARSIAAAYAELRRYALFIEQVGEARIDTLRFRLQGLKDISGTVEHIEHRATLDDIELFEVKHLAMLAGEVERLLSQHGMAGVAQIPDLGKVVDILDPDGLRLATFYVYDSYSEPLRDLREQMRHDPSRRDELLVECDAIEAQVRHDLSEQLRPHAPALRRTLDALARLDVNVAKATQLIKSRLVVPELSHDSTTAYRAMFNPYVSEALAERGRTFQPIDISFGTDAPTLITGANMGGKTVVLRTLALCQLLFQFALGIPAAAATIAVQDQVRLCMGDEQSVEQGLSSFAAEMLRISDTIAAARTGERLLALIDEPARTTNPTEGTALAASLLTVLRGRNVGLVMTTHYSIAPTEARCLRVRGLVDGRMDYTLEAVNDGETPHEALAIARSLDIDAQWLDRAAELLRKDNINDNDFTI